MSIKNGFYNADKIFSKLRHINYETGEIEGEVQLAVIAGNRKAGKTVGVCIKLIEKIEQGETFILLSRYKDEMKAGYLKKWWDKILCVKDAEGKIQAFKEAHDIKFSEDRGTIDGEVFCYCEPISGSARVKNMGSYKRCTYLIMDEAAQRGESILNILGRSAYERIIEIQETAARSNPEGADLCNIIFIMNISQRDNWVYNTLELNKFIREDTKFTVQDEVAVEIVNNEIVEEEYQKTSLGRKNSKLKAMQEYYNAAHKNEYQDNTAFIQRIGLDFKTLKIQIISNGKNIGIFRTAEGLHCAEITSCNKSEIITTDNDYYKDGVKLSNGMWEEMLFKYYQAGKLFFQTLEIKNIVLRMCGAF